MPVDVGALLRAVPPGTGRLVVARAPGRVNLIGEHTDYNGLPVLPIAVDRCIRVAARARDDGRVEAVNLDPRFGRRAFALEAAPAPSQAGDWANYLKAALQAVSDLIPPDRRRGVSLAVDSDLAAAAGLSSSSALVVAVALAVLAVHDTAVAALPLAERLAVAERYVGTLSGGMDQAAILLATAGAALRIDFFPLRAVPVPLPSGCAILVADSLVVAEKSAGARAAYNRRVVECRLACRVLAEALGVGLARLGDLATRAPRSDLADHLETLAARIPDRPLSLAALADASGIAISRLAPLLSDDAGRPLDLGDGPGFRPLARARHVLREARRVDDAATALAAGDPARVGALMTESHRSLRDDYEVSVPALDTLAAAAERAGAFGARLTGAGFGGSVVALAPRERVPDLLAALDAEFYLPRLGDGDPRRHRGVVAPAAGATVTPADAP